jgi:hypothetical protein
LNNKDDFLESCKELLSDHWEDLTLTDVIVDDIVEYLPNVF